MAYTPSFVNFSRYLDANRGAASQAAQGLADDVTQQGAGLENQLNDQVNDFNAASAAGILAPTRRGYMASNADAYTGPQSLSQYKSTDYNNLLSSADSLGSKASDLGNEAGVRTALQAKAGPAYSTGASRFDGALVNAAGAPVLSATASKYGTLSQRVRDADTAAGQTAAANTATGEQNLAGHKAAWQNWQDSDKTITQRYAGLPPAGLRPEKNSERDARKLNPLATVSPGAAAAVQDSLKNFDAYREQQEREWNKNAGWAGKYYAEDKNPYTAEHVGKRLGPLGRWR